MFSGIIMKSDLLARNSHTYLETFLLSFKKYFYLLFENLIHLYNVFWSYLPLLPLSNPPGPKTHLYLKFVYSFILLIIMITPWVKFMLSMCAWVWGHPLGQGQSYQKTPHLPSDSGWPFPSMLEFWLLLIIHGSCAGNHSCCELLYETAHVQHFTTLLPILSLALTFIQPLLCDVSPDMEGRSLL